jgi:tRNA(Ile2) C34 agmatinyltransferase TiaS
MKVNSNGHKPKKGVLKCPWCKKHFEKKRINQKYHCSNCRKRAWEKNQIIKLVNEIIVDVAKKRFGWPKE